MRDWKMTAALLGLACCLILASVIEGFSVLLVLGIAVAGIIFLWLAFRYPEFFFVAALFIPQLKAYWPLSRIDRMVDLTVAMLVGLFIGVLWRLLRYTARLDHTPRPKISAWPRWPLFAFLAFAGVIAISYSYTPAVSYGGTELMRFLGIGGLFLITPFLIIRSEHDLRRFVVLFLGAGVILAFQMIAHLNDRQTGSANDITRIGAGWLMGMLVLLALYYRPFRRNSYNTAEAWILVPIFGFALIASAARGPIVALLVVLALNLVGSTKKLSKIAWTLVLLAVSSYAAFSTFSHEDPGKYHSKFSEIVNMVEGKSTTGSAEKRLVFYRQTLAAIPSHVLLGGGLGSWSVFYYGADERGYPHNLLLEIAFEEGLLGIAAFCFFVVAVGAASIRLLRKTGTRFAVFPSLVLFCIIVSMFSGDLDDNRILWYWTGVTLAICALTAAKFADSHVVHHVFRNRALVPARHRPTIETNDPYSSPI